MRLNHSLSKSYGLRKDLIRNEALGVKNEMGLGNKEKLE